MAQGTYQLEEILRNSDMYKRAWFQTMHPMGTARNQFRLLFSGYICLLQNIKYMYFWSEQKSYITDTLT